MLFKFKSKACADLIMLEADGKRLLHAMLGHAPTQGIVQVADLPAAMQRLQAAVAQDQALRQQRKRLEGEGGTASEDEPVLPAISLAQRAAPMQKMLQRCLSQEADLVWGV